MLLSAGVGFHLYLFYFVVTSLSCWRWDSKLNWIPQHTVERTVYFFTGLLWSDWLSGGLGNSIQCFQFIASNRKGKYLIRRIQLHFRNRDFFQQQTYCVCECYKHIRKFEISNSSLFEVPTVFVKKQISNISF